jgi:general secretion pathway protein G
MLVVLAILALVATIAAPQVIGYLGKARSQTASVQIGQITSALDLFFIDNGRYPSEAEGLAALMQRPGNAPRWAGPYLKRAEGLIDPWGRAYLYRHPGAHGPYDVFSLGADANVGGSGEARDLVSW